MDDPGRATRVRLHHRPRRGAAAARGARQRGVLRRGRGRRLGLARPHRRARPGRRRPRRRAPLARLRRPAQRRHRRHRARTGSSRSTPTSGSRRGCAPRSRPSSPRRPTEVDICARALPRPVARRAGSGPSAKYPKYRLRLFRRGALPPRRAASRSTRACGRSGAPGRSRATSSTCSRTTPREALRDAWRYARLEAEQLRGPVSGGRPGPRHRRCARPPSSCYRLVVDGGWRDGWRGLAKISLDCAADALVWVLRPRRRPAPAAPRHYAKPRERRGPVRLLAIASGAERRGAAPPAGCAPRARPGPTSRWSPTLPPRPTATCTCAPLARLTPLRLIRALDAEAQLRGVDALVPCGPRERRLARLLPPELRAPFGALDPATDPAEAERLVRAATR